MRSVIKRNFIGAQYDLIFMFVLIGEFAQFAPSKLNAPLTKPERPLEELRHEFTRHLVAVANTFTLRCISPVKADGMA